MEKSTGAFRTISEVSLELDVPQHVLRFWEQKFPQIKPLKRGGGRRYYRPGDVDLIRSIRQLLYAEGYTIRGVQRLLKTQGARNVASGSAFDRAQALSDAGEGHDTNDGGETDLEADPASEAPAEALSSHDRHRLTVLLKEVRSCSARLRAAQRRDAPSSE